MYYTVKEKANGKLTSNCSYSAQYDVDYHEKKQEYSGHIRANINCKKMTAYTGYAVRS